MKTAGKTLYCYFLGFLMAIAGFPILSILSMRDADDTKYLFLFEAVDDVRVFRFENIYSIFTGIATLVMFVILFISLSDIGRDDLKPYKWKRYKMKGFVTGLIASAILIAVEVFVIWLADRYVIVAHPELDIRNLHNYVTLIPYAPFYWFYRLTDWTANGTPRVVYLTALYPAIPLTLISGFGYLMGYSDKHIIKKAPKSKFLRRIIFGKQSKKWTE